MLYEWCVSAGAIILVLPVIYYSLFGKPNKDHKFQKFFGIDHEILGNKSAVIPKKVLAATFVMATVCFGIAAVLYAFRY